MKEYLETTLNPNFYSWHAFCGLGFLQASSEWMQSLKEITKHKKGLTNYQKQIRNENRK